MKPMLLAGLFLLAGCSSGGDPAPRAPEGPPAVRVVTVMPRSLASGSSVSGVLVPREETAVGAELSGYRVARVLVEEGDYVSLGQALATLDPALLEGEIARAQVAAERARSEYARVSDLTGKGVIADETISQRGFEARSTAAQLKDLLTRRARLVLRAPASGLVLRRALRPGDVSGAGGAEPYFLIARDGRFELDAEVPEADFVGLSVGRSVPVTLASGEKLFGTVRLLSPRIDPQTKLGHVRVLLPRSRGLRAGGFASAALTDEGAPVPAVPERAVQYAAGGASVAVVGSDNRIRQVAVRTGRRGGGYVELQQGPPAGSRVVLGGASLLLSGDRVSPTEVRS